MKRLKSLLLSIAGLFLMSTPVFAADYSFETMSPRDYYGSTSYEMVYGAQYNYGGINAVDFLDPLAEEGPTHTIASGSIPEYGIPASGNSSYPGSAECVYPVQWDDIPMIPTPQITSAAEMTRADGSIGTLVIPRLDIRFNAYDGTGSYAMRKGVGHFPGTSAWDGNIGLCGHNRGSSHNIGSIKDLEIGDMICYETCLGTRFYRVSLVRVIEQTDWSYLNNTSDNRITLITCLAGQPSKRVCVQGVEVCS